MIIPFGQACFTAIGADADLIWVEARPPQEGTERHAGIS